MEKLGNLRSSPRLNLAHLETTVNVLKILSLLVQDGTTHQMETF